MIDTLTEALKGTLLNPEKVKALFSDEPSKPSPFVKEKLTHQIDVASRLAHDIIMGIADHEGLIVGFAAKKILKGNSESLVKTITAIYQKLQGNRMINQNLVVNVCEKIFKSLAVAAETVRMTENIQAHQLEAKKNN